MKTNEQIDEVLAKYNLSDEQKQLFKKMIRTAKVYQKGSEKNFRSFLENQLNEVVKNEISKD